MEGGSETLRVGLVGLGRWGRVLAQRLEETPRCRLAALCDQRPDRRAAARGAHPDASLHAEADGLFERVDAVVVAAGGAEHAALASAALGRGLHVLVEKPVALRAADARRLRAEARARGLVLSAGHLLRYDPALGELLDAVRAGELGELVGLRADRTAPRADPEPDAWWALGPHDLSLARAFLPSPARSVELRRTAHGVTARLRFAGGAEARLRVEVGALPRRRRLELLGTRGAAVVDEGAAGLEARLEGREGRRRIRAAGPGPLQRELQAFVAAALDRAELPTGPDEAVAVVELLEAGERSLRTGGPVSLREGDGPAPPRRPGPTPAAPAIGAP